MIEDIHELEEFKVYNVWSNNGVHLRCYKIGESTIKDIHGREYPYTFSYATEVDITKGNEEYNTVVTWVIESSREVEYCVECYSTSTKKKHLMVGKDLNTLRIDCLNALKSREIYVEMKREANDLLLSKDKTVPWRDRLRGFFKTNYTC